MPARINHFRLTLLDGDLGLPQVVEDAHTAAFGRFCCKSRSDVLIDGSTDKILFAVAILPENPSSLSKPDRNHFLAFLAWTSSKILLQQNRHRAD